MATQADPKDLDYQEQMAKIRRDFAEINQRQMETKLEFPKFLVGSIIAAMGAGAAIGGLLVSLLSN